MEIATFLSLLTINVWLGFNLKGSFGEADRNIWRKGNLYQEDYREGIPYEKAIWSKYDNFTK